MNEVVRAGIRLPMERDGARRFYALKADLEHAMRDAETGAFADFDTDSILPRQRVRQPRQQQRIGRSREQEAARRPVFVHDLL